MAIFVIKGQHVALILLVVVMCQVLVNHLCGAASLPTSAGMVPGTAACANRDPCSSFPGLCSTGGGLCVLKGPCEYECVCPPDGRRGRDCTGGRENDPSAQKEEESKTPQRGSLINSLLVFPQDLFWDLNQVLRPEESVKMMLSTPANVVQPGTASTLPSPTLLPESLSLLAVVTPQPKEQSSVKDPRHYVPSFTSSTTEKTQTSNNTQISSDTERTMTNVQTTPASSIFSISILLSRLTTASKLQETTTKATATTTTTTTSPESPIIVVGYGAGEKAELANVNTAGGATTKTTTPPETTSKPATFPTSTSSTITESVITSRPPQLTATHPVSISTLSNLNSKIPNSDVTTSSVNDAINNITDSKITIPRSTPSQRTRSVPQTTSSPTSTPKNKRTATAPTSNFVTSKAAAPITAPVLTQTVVQEKFPGHETFPTFFLDVFDDANKEEKDPLNAEMSKGVRRVFFPLPPFMKIRREEE